VHGEIKVNIKMLVLAALMAMSVTKVYGETIDQTPRTLTDIRYYGDGSLVMRFTPAVTGTGCLYPDHLILVANAPSIKGVTALALTALTTRRKVLIIWNNTCVLQSIGATGLVLMQQ
jgi:hypothetical protein